jgi:hypothetical protein
MMIEATAMSVWLSMGFPVGGSGAQAAGTSLGMALRVRVAAAM